MDVTLLSFFADIPLFILVIVVLILVHEFGHFIVAKWSGMRVDEFGLGFPPKLWSKQYGETEYTINALPFGGFVKIHGEDPTAEPDEDTDSSRNFSNQAKWKQAATLMAGVVMNVLLGWALFAIAFMIGMPNIMPITTSDEVSERRLLVSQVLADSPAAKAGIEPRSQLLSLAADGERIDDNLSPSSVNTFVTTNASSSIAITYRPPGTGAETTKTATVTPATGVLESAPNDPAVGFSMQQLTVQQFPPHIALIEGAEYTGKLLVFITQALGGLLADAVTGNADADQVTGPVGLVAYIGGISEFGTVFLLVFVGAISLNLAIINIVPFPALDGGRLLFLAIEAVKGSPLKPEIANWANAIGFFLLIALMIAITIKDVFWLTG
jgi:regulator of sigma E protease